MTELGNTRRRTKLAELVKYAFIVLGVLAVVVGVWAIHTYRYKGDVEHISFQSGDVTMKGLFIKPDGSGPHPVVVLLHGRTTGWRRPSSQGDGQRLLAIRHRCAGL